MFERLRALVEVDIGGFAVQKVAQCLVVTAANSPVDRAELVLPVEGLEPQAIRRDAEVTIQAGYHEKGSWTLFVGQVVDVAWGPRVRVLCRDRMDGWRKTRLTQALVDVTARDVVDFVARQVGWRSVRLSDSPTSRRHYFVLAGQNAIESIRLVNRTWGLPYAFYIDPETGEFFWGPWDESPRREAEVVQFEYGVNVIRLEPFTMERYGLLETIFVPYLRHSQLIRVVDRRYWGQDISARVERITHVVSERKARSIVEWSLAA